MTSYIAIVLGYDNIALSVYCIIIPGIWHYAFGIRHYNVKMCNYNVSVWLYDDKI